MSYSVKVILHPYQDKNELHKVYLQIIFNRIKLYEHTDFKLKASQYKDEIVINHPNKDRLNHLLKRQKIEIEGKLLDAMKHKNKFNKEELTQIINGDEIRKDFISNFIEEITRDLKGKLSSGRLRYYKVIQKKLLKYNPDLTITDMTKDCLNDIERYLRNTGIGSNTLNQNMKAIKSILYRAAEKKLITKDLFEDYRVPKYEQPIPEYLNEEEINRLQSFIDAIDKPGHKLAGYYFLLSCYAGFRISDVKRFDYTQMVKENNIIIRAKKNRQVISIPIHSRLKNIIDYIKDKPLTLSEQKIRQYVKELCAWIGIKKHIKYHASRHSFAVLLMNKGFSIDETSELLGDSPEVGRIYARISNEQLRDKFKQAFD